MQVRIGVLHDRDVINLEIKNGCYDIFNSKNEIILSSFSGEIAFNLKSAVPAIYDWYEKIDSFVNAEDIEKIREKYYQFNKKVRIEKVGRKFSKLYDNYEFWVLQKVSKPRIHYTSGDYRYKKIIKKPSHGIIDLSNQYFSGKFILKPCNKEARIVTKNVEIGIGFHWNNFQDLTYKDTLEISISNQGMMQVVNVLEFEDYLSSVNSSEMRNDNNYEMLKAQSIIARCTLLATMGKHHFSDDFDLCADDHCQCYQGETRLSALSVRVAKETQGKVLIFDKKICDARYSKICGGITERYSSCWEDMDYPYLQSFADNKNKEKFLEIKTEDNAKLFIDDHIFDCFCNTIKYDLPESLSFCKPNFRWHKKYSIKDFEELIKINTKEIVKAKKENFKVIKRGQSGRIIEIELIGIKRTFRVSKELNIRKIFSDSYLPSSAFYLNFDNDYVIINGAGWGHGVGLCQVGAQVMGSLGYSYKDILTHYYPNTTLKKIIYD